MGIKHLWTILTPFCERKPLFELQGKTVAVDLSCWICEAQNIAEYQVQPRMYLRNLYFRTCFLLLMEVNPVFVLEGKAPELKYDTIAARNAIQFKGAKPRTDGVRTGKDRSRFHFVLRQCEEMLGYMGLVCITGQGEAESLCAYLNEDGLVDGCISQDSDCFAYGAKVVYRNFSISTQGAYSASGGAVDIYDIRKANQNLNFGRNKIIGLALLCGSDYSNGVMGVGKELALKLFETLSDEETLDRLRSWRKDPALFEKFENQVSDKSICTSCGHQGKLQAHNKTGCTKCSTTKGCDPFKFKEERLSIRNELNIRNKALQDPNFPDENLISEYLIKKDNVSKINVKWKQPNLVGFVNFSSKFLQWEQIYAFEKMLPILTRWQCLNYNVVDKEDGSRKGILKPDHIKKIRIPKGVASYEIVWSDPDNYFKGLIPEIQLLENNAELEKLWSTVEPQILIDKAYPELVHEFKQSKIKPKKASKRKKKEVGTDGVVMTNTSVSEPAPKKTRKPRAPKKKESESELKKKPKTTNDLKELESSFNQLTMEKSKKSTILENFLKKAVHNSQKQKNDSEIIIPDKSNCQTSTPSKSVYNRNSVLNFELSCFGDEDDLDLSDIVESIVSRKPEYIKEQLKKININVIEEELKTKDLLNASSFFITAPVENDLFEQTFNAKEDSGDDTEEYEFHENLIDNVDDENFENVDADVRDFDKNSLYDEKEKVSSEPERNKEIENDDSFCDVYVPLLERLNKKH